MKLIIADDHAIVREGLKHYIRTISNIEQIDEVSNGTEAWAKIMERKYDLAILDVSMPGLSGIEILQNIKNHNLATNVLILSVHPEEQYAIRAFRLGASGYISKDSAYEELILAINKISSGGRYIGRTFAEKFAFNGFDANTPTLHETLSEREYQVMIRLAKGHSVSEIAETLFLSDKTISTYRTRIFGKLGIKKNAELTMYAIKHNLIELE